ncbi:MAG: type II/IV secretion system protein [Phycisphaeraceae bacterium]|nr:type II/IV secretion system protein [Phycisphaeraceae bacterium]MBX3405892.1 type II/IV secretion system protein [Phycisphaeraceae bacterium]
MGIGTLLMDRGLISREQLEDALSQQQASGERLDRILVRMGLVDSERVLHVVGDQFHMPVIDLATVEVKPEVLQILPAKLVYRQNCVPISRENGTLRVATSDPFELPGLDELRLLTGCSIEVVLADDDELRNFIRAHYGVGSDTLDEMSAGLLTKAEADPAQAEVEQAQEASVIKLVNDVLAEAITERATDVHIEPYERELTVRYRIDGVLQRANVPPTINRFAAAIISRLKIMASLNIAEKRKPQDGRITFKHKGREYDLRVSVIPMLFGEGVVLRILNKAAVMLGLADLGMPRHVADIWERMILRPHGILLVTGPTGSGKSTTLYASLNTIVSDEVKVITVEDPVEYHVPGVNQIQVNHKVGLDFAEGLRSILRHDPDVVMIGEIRDKETAETAIQASLTGHLVFSTLHTNDAPGAATRLLDMGVEPFLVASSVECVLAQRLVRRVCQECSQPYVPDHADLPPDLALAEGQTLVRGAGCRSCRNTGYRGRLGVYEVLRMTDELREKVMERVNAHRIAAAAEKSGDLFRLRQDGFAKALAGVTTIDEVAAALAT